jgi:hypothetical protein
VILVLIKKLLLSFPPLDEENMLPFLLFFCLSLVPFWSPRARALMVPPRGSRRRVVPWSLRLPVRLRRQFSFSFSAHGSRASRLRHADKCLALVLDRER